MVTARIVIAILARCRQLLLMLLLPQVIACDSTASLFARTNEPMLYLVLTTDILPQPKPVLTAVLGTTGSATSFEYRTASTFTLSRLRDNAAFSIVSHQPLASFDGGPLLLPRDGNFALEELSGANGLGRVALADGESYRLHVITEGRDIVGTATVPAHPTPSFARMGDSIRIVWPKVANSPLYLVQGVDVGPRGFVTDTLITIAANTTDANQTEVAVRITAVDQNYGDFVFENRTVSGISGAYGLFGAMSSTDIVVPLNRRAN